MESNQEVDEGCFCTKKCDFVVRSGEGKWRPSCGTGGNGEGRVGGSLCALRNGGARRRTLLDG